MERAVLASCVRALWGGGHGRGGQVSVCRGEGNRQVNVCRVKRQGRWVAPPSSSSPLCSIRQYELVVHEDMDAAKLYTGEMGRLKSYENQKP